MSAGTTSVTVLRLIGPVEWRSDGRECLDAEGRTVEWFSKDWATKFRAIDGYRGHSCRYDAQGREWIRLYDAVMDDFGNLVEVTL